MEAETVASIRGKNKIILNGFIYVKQKNLANNVISYECERRRGTGKELSECKAKVKVNGEDLSVVSYLHAHSHAADSARCEMVQARARIKRKAEETEETPQQILGHELQQLSQQAAVQMVPLRHVRRTIRMTKQRKNAVHPIPSDRTFEIPEEYRSLQNGENFLLHDSGMDDLNRILVFGTERSLQMLRDSQHWFMDGTFKVVPELFFQLYTIHVQNLGAIIPSLYVLLPNKKQETYRRLFEEIKRLPSQANPTSVTMDFEKAAMNAIQESFGEVEIHGCFYHLAQNVYRKIQAEGLQERYMNDENVSLSMRMLTALAFVPVDEVIKVFEAIEEEMSDEFHTIVDYFEDTYIGRLRRHRRAKPTFDLHIWNVYSRVTQDLPRTNNAVEGWNRKMQSAVSCQHPNLWKFFNILKKEQSLNNVAIEQLLGGHVPQPSRKKYKDYNGRIYTIVADFSKRNIFYYLKGIAQNINF